MSSVLEKINSIKHSFERFFDLFVNNFNPHMPFEQFDKFRLFFINSLNEVINRFFLLLLGTQLFLFRRSHY